MESGGVLWGHLGFAVYRFKGLRVQVTLRASCRMCRIHRITTCLYSQHCFGVTLRITLATTLMFNTPCIISKFPV